MRHPPFVWDELCLKETDRAMGRSGDEGTHELSDRRRSRFTLHSQ
jgi:hypothetical protein